MGLFTGAMLLIAWLILGLVALVAIPLFLVLPAYTMILAVVTILRAKRRTTTRGGGVVGNPPPPAIKLGPWGRRNASFFRSTVSHVRRRPVLCSFEYLLHFVVVDCRQVDRSVQVQLSASAAAASGRGRQSLSAVVTENTTCRTARFAMAPVVADVVARRRPPEEQRGRRTTVTASIPLASSLS